MRDPLDHEGLMKALELLSDFEKRANLRVCESGVLQGLNIDDIKLPGERIILRDGCKKFFQNISLSNESNSNAFIRHRLDEPWG